jgi:curved DNA-binding protein CbpA
MRDYYRILGIRADATQAEIKDAWNFSVKAFHPDKFAGSSLRQQAIAHERTKAINEAYGVLSDPIKRANYDRGYKQETGTKSAAASYSSSSPPEDTATARPSAPPPTQTVQKTASNRPNIAEILAITFGVAFVSVFVILLSGPASRHTSSPSDGSPPQMADTATIKKWVDEAAKRGEEWGDQSQQAATPEIRPVYLGRRLSTLKLTL